MTTHFSCDVKLKPSTYNIPLTDLYSGTMCYVDPITYVTLSNIVRKGSNSDHVYVTTDNYSTHDKRYCKCLPNFIR